MSHRTAYVARGGIVYRVSVDHMLRSEDGRWRALVRFVEQVPPDLIRQLTEQGVLAVPASVVRDTREEAERDVALRKLRLL